MESTGILQQCFALGFLGTYQPLPYQMFKRGGEVGNLFNTVKDMYLTKSEAKRKIKTFFQHCRDGGFKPMLYYTGHGQVGTGNWCFADGTISIEEIVLLLPRMCMSPTIVCDTCYSGNWANFCCEKKGFTLSCLSACPEYCTAWDTGTFFITELMFRW